MSQKFQNPIVKFGADNSIKSGGVKICIFRTTKTSSFSVIGWALFFGEFLMTGGEYMTV